MQRGRNGSTRLRHPRRSQLIGDLESNLVNENEGLKTENEGLKTEIKDLKKQLELQTTTNQPTKSNIQPGGEFGSY